MSSVVTVDELHSLRQRRAELDAVTSSLRGLGHTVPEAVATELSTLDSATVDVIIRCLLCGTFGTYRAAVDGEATPHAAICADCDRRCWGGVDTP
jgi:hypothetical protein